MSNLEQVTASPEYDSRLGKQLKKLTSQLEQKIQSSVITTNTYENGVVLIEVPEITGALRDDIAEAIEGYRRDQEEDGEHVDINSEFITDESGIHFVRLTIL